MAVRKLRPSDFKPDYKNRNPFRGLPSDYPTSHSRFPIVPSEGYGGISFVPPMGDNVGRVEETKERREALKDAFDQVVSDKVVGGKK